MFDSYKIEKIATEYNTFCAEELLNKDLSNLDPRKLYICTYDGSNCSSPFLVIYRNHIYDMYEISAIYKKETNNKDENYVFDRADLFIVLANYFEINKFYDLSYYC